MTLIPVERTTASRIGQVDFNNLDFGLHMSDHILVAEYSNGQWGAARIKPYGTMEFYPAMMALHYGQSVFEGLKAFRMENGDISVFRAATHLERFNRSLERMCMPTVPASLFLDGLFELIRTDQDWVSGNPGCSLYLRPFCFASEARLKIKVAEKYHFIILTSPAGPYYTKPYRLKVETEYTRTVEGGTGFAKCAGNYGSSYYPMQLAFQEGYDQVLWTDGKEHKYIDEVGMMNVMFMIDGVLTTPKLNTAILSGVTRDSVLTLAKDMGVRTEERRISVEEIETNLKQGRISEAFGTGTAAVVAPITTINISGTDHQIPEPTPSSFQSKVKNLLSDMRTGRAADIHGWNHIIQI